MKIMLWNVTKERQVMTGVKRYEEELYKNLKILADDFGFKIERIRRNNNLILGSTFVSWILKYRCRDADIVHATMETLAPIVKIRKPKKFIVTCHGLLPLLSPSDTIKDFTTWMTWKLVPDALRRADKIIAVSKFTKNELIKFLGIEEEKIKVIYHGVDHKVYRPMNKEYCRSKLGLSIDYKYILVVASGLRQKRLDIVKRVFSETRRIREDIRLLYVGFGELSGDGIINLGVVKGEDMPLIYNSADVYFHPSEYESFGLPILEAMACGVPVVASNKGSIPEIVGSYKYVVDIDDERVIDLFVEKIISYIDEGFSKKVLEQSKKFTWEKTAKSTINIYRQMVGGNHAS